MFITPSGFREKHRFDCTILRRFRGNSRGGAQGDWGVKIYRLIKNWKRASLSLIASLFSKIEVILREVPNVE